MLQGIPRLGIMAFEGRFPILLAQAAAQLGIPVTAFGVKGMTPDELADYVDRLHWLQLGQFNKFIDKLHEEGIKHVIMGGRVQHNSIWRYRGFDRRSLKLLGKLVNRKADTVLNAVVDELARENITVLDSTLLLRECMPAKGVLTVGCEPTREQYKDIEFGLPLAHQIAGMDIGQTIIVKDLAVVAVEGLEGTDEAIRRAGRIANGGIVVIKVPKPRQDYRFDFPVIGPGTIRSIAKAGGGALAIIAEHALFFDQQEALELALENQIPVVALSPSLLPEPKRLKNHA
ncbi:MAG: LpxI family protein [Candidatus Sumerlaeia bacterium]